MGGAKNEKYTRLSPFIQSLRVTIVATGLGGADDDAPTVERVALAGDTAILRAYALAQVKAGPRETTNACFVRYRATWNASAGTCRA